MRTLSIAAIQTAAVPRDLDATWERFAAQVRAVVAMRPHVDLVVVPELLLAAPGPLLVEDPEFDVRAATTIPGPVTDRLGDARPRARRVARARLAGRARR